MNKSATFSGNWPQYMALILLISGFVLAFNIDSPIIIYLVSYIAGLQCGILTYTNVNKTRSFPIWFIIGGFLIGYLIGSYKANKLSVILLFVLGIINGHILFKKNAYLFERINKNDKKIKRRSF